jgi:hypothetical protein
MTDAAPRTHEGAGVDGPPQHEGGPRRPRPSFMRAETPRRLTRLLLLKSLAELLLVAALAASLFLIDVRAGLTGGIERVEGGTLKGWVEGGGDEAAVEIQLFIDGRFASSALAERVEPARDLQRAEADSRHHFTFQLAVPPDAEHEARAYAVTGGREGVRRTLTLLGQPVRFRIAREEGR